MGAALGEKHNLIRMKNAEESKGVVAVESSRN